MVEKCVRCERDDREVKLLNAIDNKEVIKICEECATLENMPVIRKPTLEQLDNISNCYQNHKTHKH
jgi:hypothetical protein